MLRRLLEAGKQCGSTALMMASEEGNPGVVRVLLAAGANKEAKDTVGGGGGAFRGSVRGEGLNVCKMVAN